MKFTVPGIMITALLVASPAFAQYTSAGSASTPSASVAKDDTTKATKQSKKHMASASHKKKYTASASHKQKMKSKAQTTGSCLLWANSGLMQCSKELSLFDHLVGEVPWRF